MEEPAIFILPGDAAQLVQDYGYGAVAAAIGIESVGIPFPGETTLVAAAIYAGASGQMNIGLIVAAAIAGAVLGDNIGFWIGRRFGFRLLLRLGPRVGMTEPRIKLGQYLFHRHGGKVVFFGRFVAVLRALAAVLAGAYGLSWQRFLTFNAGGAIAWASIYGFGAYLLGEQVNRLIGPVGAGLFATAAVLAVLGLVFVRRHEQRLIRRAEHALPGPVRAAPIPV